MNSRRQGDDNVKTNRQTAGSVGEFKWCDSGGQTVQISVVSFQIIQNCANQN